MKTLQEILLENLRTHNSKLLLKKLYDYFEDSILMVTDFDGKPILKNEITTLMVYLTNKAEYMDQQKLEHLCDMYGYEISKMGVRWCAKLQERRPYIMLEPREGKDQKLELDSLLKECDGNLFHLTDCNNLRSICENGLRIRNAAYRKFQKRIYLVTFENGQLDADAACDFAVKVLGGIKDWCAIRLDLSNLKIPIYKDTLMLNDYAYYTYTNIPAKYIKDVTVFNYNEIVNVFSNKEEVLKVM